MTLEELRNALEAATEPDRSIDEALALYLGWRMLTTSDGVRYWLQPNAPDLDLEVASNRLDPRVTLGYPAHFTGSIDVALRLVPENHGWGLEGPGGWTVWWQWPDGNEVARAIGKTPALALCLARVEYEIARDQALREAGA